MELELDRPAAGEIVAQAVIDLLAEGEQQGAFGFIVEARLGFPLDQVLAGLAAWDQAFVSLIGLPAEYPTIEELIRDSEWTHETLGGSATHAVHVRNQAPPQALKVAIVWSEEDRLHSLSRRGYVFLGTDKLLGKIANIAQGGAPNQPQRNLWTVLGHPDRPVSMTLDGLVAYCAAIFSSDVSNSQNAPREALTKLGLLRDSQLLGNYSSVQEIHHRLASNASMVARLQTGDQKDRQKSLRAVERAPESDKDELRKAYRAFLRLSRGEAEAIEELDLDMASRLFRGKRQVEDDGDPTIDIDTDDDSDGEKGSDADNGIHRRQFSDIELAALDLALSGEDEDLAELAAEAKRVLGESEMQKTDVKTKSVIAAFDPNVKAIVLAQDTLRMDRLGGVISGQAPVDAILQEIGRYADDVRAIDSVTLEEIRTLASRAEEALPEFEGGTLLEDFLEARTALLPDLELLATAPFTAIAAGNVKDAAELVISSYGRLVDHLEQQYASLRKIAADGAQKLYRSILALDVILVEGSDESVALVAPLHPLVLWKYVEIANLCDHLGAAIDPADRELLLQELQNLPEPLSAIFLPSLKDDPELGYVGRRIGAFPLYRNRAIERADVGRQTIERAGQKLLALYPAARYDFRILLLNPVATHEASKAAKSLVQGHAVEHITLITARTAGSPNVGADREDQTLDELHSEGKLGLEEIRAGTVDEVLAEVAVRPVHLLVVSGQEEKGVETIEREATRLHPLSIPHRLHADQLTKRVSLKPRSLQPEDGAVPHPFALYQDLVAEMAGNRTERTMAQRRQVSLDDIRPLLPHCLFLCAAGIPEEENDPTLMRLSQGRGALGDSTFTMFGDRIVEGIDRMLRELNYVPKEEGIRQLIDQLEEIAADEIFATISEKGSTGFSDSALRGLLGLAVALGWYKSTASGGDFLVISMDTFRARQWLRRRPDGKRVDLIGFRKNSDGDVCVDVIEVKSYEATASDVASSYPASQLLAVASVLRQIFGKTGDVLTDRRRELLRRQVYSEGLLVKVGADKEWVEALNDVLDGNRIAKVHLKLIELAFAENSSVTKQTFVLKEPGSRIDGLKAERLRLGEKEIQRQLAGFSLEPSQIDSVTEIEVQPPQSSPEESKVLQGSGGDSANARAKEEVASGEHLQESEAEPEDRAMVAEREADRYGPDIGFEPSDQERAQIADLAKALYRAMRDVGVQVAEPIDPLLADVGPTIVRFKVRLRPEERTSNAKNRARDIMRELAAQKEPIIDVLPNTSYIYVDIPRPERRIAQFSPEIARTHSGDNLTVPFGVAPEGGLRSYDLASLPHMLVAGTTGSGKTMFLYSIISALIESYSKEAVRLILVDPKQTDFVYFENISHLGSRGVITDPEVAIGVLRELLDTELDRRTKQLRHAKARDITAFNSRGDEKMPRIVVIIDEFADLADIMDGAEREEFDASLRRLAQRARNVGIHLILATQRPTTDIVNGTIKANLPCRVSFRLSSHIDSQTILDTPGAEKLLGNGDMLVSWNGDVRRLQGLFVGEEYLIGL